MKRFFVSLCLLAFLAGCLSPVEKSVTSTSATESEVKVEETPKLEDQQAESLDATEQDSLQQETTKQEGTHSNPKAESKLKEVAPVQAAQPEQTAKPLQTTKPVQTAPAPVAQASVSQPPVSPTPVPVKSESVPEPAKQQVVTLSITADEQVGTILQATEVAIEEGDTVLDVLKKATKANKIPMEFRGSGAVAYVEGIDNLYEFDRGPKSGWMYRVNGVFGKQSAGSEKLKPKDRIEWLYTLDLGKDLE